MNNKEKGELIRHHILQDVVNHARDIAKHIANYYSITPQAVHNHLKKLEQDSWLESAGRGKGKRYFLGEKRLIAKDYHLINNIFEDEIWRRDVAHILEGIPEAIVDICQYGFTEIVNNALDHSGGDKISILVFRDIDEISILISDDGEGIFRKIKLYYKLDDERQALFELSKGKLTTDPEHHTGEGIFFTSRAFDWFYIDSKGIRFRHQEKEDFDFLVDTDHLKMNIGTAVGMVILRNSSRKLGDVFDEFAEPDEFRFSKTLVQLKLAKYKDEKLISRSQAKRILNRVDKFTNVVFDFEDIDSVGQAFSDEIFRVFARKNPEIKLVSINMTGQVEKMIKRAQYHE